jgi:hypothetical protein
LDAHPAHDESEVSLRICSRDIGFTPFLDAGCLDVRHGGKLKSGFQRRIFVTNRKSKIENRK